MSNVQYVTDTRSASLNFKDDDPANPIMYIVFGHSSIVGKGKGVDGGEYENPDKPSQNRLYGLYKWTKIDRLDFTRENDGYLCAFDAVIINKHHQDVWAVAYQRRHNRYVEYLQQVEGFWKKLEEEVVKKICNDAIDVADLFDDEVTTPALTATADEVVHQIFTKGDGNVIIRNWVHWDSYNIFFTIGSNKAHIRSTHHHTSCAPERFGAQDQKK